MAPAFPKIEYDKRVERVRKSMRTHGIEVIIITNPANINWLTGYDAWSFYTPQFMLLDLNSGPFWIGREMDAGAANFTTYLESSEILSYPEELVQRSDIHPSEFLISLMKERGYKKSVIGFETDTYFASKRSLDLLHNGLNEAKWMPTDLLVNWVRIVKSEAELVVMKQAGQIAELAMQTAYKNVKVGVRQSDLMADILASQIKGTSEFGGDMPALHPLILAGEAASTAHPMWTDEKLKPDQTVAFELGGCRKRYNVGLARTVHLGTKKSETLLETTKVVQEGMAAVIDSLRAEVLASEVHSSWQKVLNKYGMEKKSRIGYSIGVGYPPDWGEHTLSFRPEETKLVPENAVVHIILGMWMDGWGMELSETLHVRAKDCVKLSNFSQEVPLIS